MNWQEQQQQQISQKRDLEHFVRTQEPKKKPHVDFVGGREVLDGWWRVAGAPQRRRERCHGEGPGRLDDGHPAQARREHLRADHEAVGRHEVRHRGAPLLHHRAADLGFGVSKKGWKKVEKVIMALSLGGDTELVGWLVGWLDGW